MNLQFVHKLAGCILAAFLVVLGGGRDASALTRDELRAQYQAIEGLWDENLFTQTPVASAPYTVGSLRPSALESALAEANFIRSIAGLSPLELSEELSGIAQAGALLQAANGYVSHSPERPADMPDALWSQGNLAASECNLAAFSWSSPDLLTRSVSLFARDEGKDNEDVLGHRRWLLCPSLRYTGFGLAQDANGVSYTSMYVMNRSAEGSDYDYICWPAGGAFPAEYLTPRTQWSISPNPAKFDLANSSPQITLAETTSGRTFSFRLGSGLTINDGRYGEGAAMIFRPSMSDFEGGYTQNQSWTLTLSGMVAQDGTPAEPLTYQTDIVALEPIAPAAVEVSPLTATLSVGETLLLKAAVVPSWADDLSVSWLSASPAIASVDQNGLVTALAPGRVEITAWSINGKSDTAVLEVK